MVDLPYTDASRHLAQIVINDGREYRDRVSAIKDIARPRVQHIKARAFVMFASEAAARFTREFPDAQPFTAQDVLFAALELIDYYERHVREGA